MQTKFLENEFWYGGAVYESYRQPVEQKIPWYGISEKIPQPIR